MRSLARSQSSSARDVAADAEAAIAAQVAVAVEHRQAGQFDRDADVGAVGRERDGDAAPGVARGEARARRGLRDRARASAAISLHGRPSAAAVRGPISGDEFVRADGEAAVGIHLPDEAQRRAAVRRACLLSGSASARPAAASQSGCGVRCRLRRQVRHCSIRWRRGVCFGAAAGRRTAGLRRAIRQVSEQHGRRIRADALEHDRSVDAPCRDRVPDQRLAGEPAPIARSANSGRAARAAGVACMQLASAGRSPALRRCRASRRFACSASESFGPAASVATTRIAGVRSASMIRAQLQSSAPPKRPPKPRSRSSRGGAPCGSVPASRAICSAAEPLGSMMWPVSADGEAALKIAAAVGIGPQDARGVRAPQPRRQTRSWRAAQAAGRSETRAENSTHSSTPAPAGGAFIGSMILLKSS